MEDLGLKIEVEWLWIEDKQSKFEDSIMPHQHLIHMFLLVLCRESRYFEDIITFSGSGLDRGYSIQKVSNAQKHTQTLVFLQLFHI